MARGNFTITLENNKNNINFATSLEYQTINITSPNACSDVVAQVLKMYYAFINIYFKN